MRNDELELKAKFIFGHALDGHGWVWAGPVFDFDRDSYKARIDSGPLKGEVRFLSCEKLDDLDVSANDLNELLDEITQSQALQQQTVDC